jgi:hypothetical protein
MSLQAAVRARLVSQAGVTSIVGQRVYPEARAQDAPLPCIVYGINNETALGLLASPAGSWKADVEIVAIAATKSDADAITAAVIKAMDGFVGTLASTEIQHSIHSRSVTAYNAPQTGEPFGSFLHTAVFSIMHKG